MFASHSSSGGTSASCSNCACVRLCFLSGTRSIVHSYEADVVKPLTCFFSRESRVEAQGHFALRRSSLPLNPRFLTIVLGRDLRAGLAHKSFSYFFFLERFPPET